MPHDQHQRDAESSRWEPNPPDYWPNTSNPDPEKRDPVPGDPDPTMPPPERRRNPSPDHGRPIRGRMNHDTIFPSTIHDEIELR
jgi:hypothetical protein